MSVSARLAFIGCPELDRQRVKAVDLIPAADRECHHGSVAHGRRPPVEGRDHPELDSVAYAGDLVALARVDDVAVRWEAYRGEFPDFRITR